MKQRLLVSMSFHTRAHFCGPLFRQQGILNKDGAYLGCTHIGGAYVYQTAGNKFMFNRGVLFSSVSQSFTQSLPPRKARLRPVASENTPGCEPARGRPLQRLHTAALQRPILSPGLGPPISRILAPSSLNRSETANVRAPVAKTTYCRATAANPFCRPWATSFKHLGAKLVEQKRDSE